jgi:prepilin-type processing-associated H-X9-DG protein
LGRDYHGGHFAEKWPLPQNPTIKPWVAPYYLTGSSNLILFSDLISQFSGTAGTFIAHSSRGAATGKVNQSPMDLVSNSGGNIGYLDGSVAWKPLRDMEKHYRAKNFGSKYMVSDGGGNEYYCYGYW